MGQFSVEICTQVGQFSMKLNETQHPQGYLTDVLAPNASSPHKQNRCAAPVELESVGHHTACGNEQLRGHALTLTRIEAHAPP